MRMSGYAPGTQEVLLRSDPAAGGGHSPDPGKFFLPAAGRSLLLGCHRELPGGPNAGPAHMHGVTYRLLCGSIALIEGLRINQLSSMKYSNQRLLEAINFSALAHAKQLRKHPEGQPYIGHPFMVASILMQYEYPEDVVIAGLLHDVVEDTSYTADDIEKMFGPTVRDLVLDVTEDKTLQYGAKKLAYIEQVKRAGESSRAISAADILANRLDLISAIEKGENPWKNFNAPAEKVLALDEKRLAAINLPGNPLFEEVKAAVKKIKSLIVK